MRVHANPGPARPAQPRVPGPGSDESRGPGSSAFTRHSMRAAAGCGCPPGRSRNPPPSAMAICSAIEIHAGHRFGDRMLHLDAGIHFQEIERLALPIYQEFHRARPLDSEAPCEARTAASCSATSQRSRQIRRRRFLDAASDSAVVPSSRALRDESRRPVHHPGSGPPHAGRASQSAPGTRAHRRTLRPPPLRPVPASQASPPRLSTRFMPRPPPPPDRLDQQRRADRRGEASAVLGRGHCAAGHHRNAGRFGLGARAQLVAHGLDLRRGRTDEDHALLLAESARMRRRSERKPYPGWIASAPTASAA